MKNDGNDLKKKASKGRRKWLSNLISKKIPECFFYTFTLLTSTISPANASGVRMRNEVRNSSSTVQMVNKGKSEEFGSVRNFRNKRDKVKGKGRGRSLKEKVVEKNDVKVFSESTVLAVVPKVSESVLSKSLVKASYSPILMGKNVEGIKLPTEIKERMIKYKKYKYETSSFISNTNKFTQNKKEFSKNKNQISWINWVVKKCRGGSIADKSLTLKNSDSLVDEKLSMTKISKLWSFFAENVRPILIPIITTSILEWMARDRHNREDPPIWAYTKLSWKMKELEKVVNNLEEKTKPAKNLTNIFLWCMTFLLLMLWFLDSSLSKRFFSTYLKENSFYGTCLQLANSLLVRVVFFRDYKEYNDIPVKLREDYDQLIEDIHKYYEFVKKYKKEMDL